MKKKRAGEVTLEGLDLRLDGFEGSLDKFGGRLDGFEETLGEFKGTLKEFGGTLGEFRVTLKEIGEMLGFVVERMVTKDDAKKFATKDDLNEGLFTLQTQMNGIESNIREIKHSRLDIRVADLEEKVFGKPR